MNKILLQDIQDKTSLENTLFFLIRILYPQIIKQYKESNIEHIILLYLRHMVDDYGISLAINTKTNEKYFVFMYLSFTSYDDIKNSINIPYIDTLRKLYNDITTNKLQQYIKLKLKEKYNKI
ncbi:MAG: hypothetical protein IKO49_01565 [Bacilli bacterium]|nr:hypothetical protein [Clostridia bacterium]MBR4617988.1 hypothetical protein [Bacilli bacterium]